MKTVLIALLVVLAGCAGKSAETAFLTTEQVILAFQVGVAKQYVECDSEAQTAAEEQECYEAKEAHADELDKAVAAFRAYGLALIAADEVPPDGTALAQARAILAALMPELQGYIDPSYRQAVAWVEG